MRMKMFLLNRSARLFFCGRYAVVLQCLATSSLHTAATSLPTNQVPFLVSKYAGLWYGMSQWSVNRFATCVGVVLDAGTAYASLK